MLRTKQTKFGAQFFFCTCQNVFRDSLGLTYSLPTFPQPPVSSHFMHPMQRICIYKTCSRFP